MWKSPSESYYSTKIQILYFFKNVLTTELFDNLFSFKYHEDPIGIGDSCDKNKKSHWELFKVPGSF